MTKPLTVSCLVYGQDYAAIFASSYLTAFLAESNAGTAKDRLRFELFTDQQTLDLLRGAELFHRLRDTLPLTIRRLPVGLTYDQRYNTQALQIQHGLKTAVADGTDWMCTTADTCLGAGVIPTVLKDLDAGHDAVMGTALRVGSPHVCPVIQSGGTALDADALFALAFPHLHPIWVASLWDSSHFTSVPYCLTWTDGQQLLVRKPAIDAWAIRPTEGHLALRGCSDMVLWRLAENAKWYTDFTALPIVLTEPLHCFYPPWQFNYRTTTVNYLDWARQHIAPDALANLWRRWTFKPSTMLPNQALVAASDTIIRDILTRAGQWPVQDAA